MAQDLKPESEVIVIDSDEGVINQSVIVIDDSINEFEGDGESGITSSPPIAKTGATARTYHSNLDLASSPILTRLISRTNASIISTPLRSKNKPTLPSNINSSPNEFILSSSQHTTIKYYQQGENHTVEGDSDLIRMIASSSTSTPFNRSQADNESIIVLGSSDIGNLDFDRKENELNIGRKENETESNSDENGYSNPLSPMNSASERKTDDDKFSTNNVHSSIFGSDGFGDIGTTIKSRKLSISGSSSPTTLGKSKRFEFTGDLTIDDTDVDEFDKFISQASKIKTSGLARKSRSIPTAANSSSSAASNSDTVASRSASSTAASKRTSKSAQRKEEAELKKAEKLALKIAANEEKKKKKELDQVNKKKASRSACVNEIIINLSPNIFDAELGKLVKDQVAEFEAEVIKKSIDDLSDEIFQLISFQRKKTTKYDSNQDMYIPTPLEINTEPTTVIYIEGKDAIEVLLDERLKKDHLDKIDRLAPNNQILYLIEGLHNHLKKVELELDRKFAGRVRDLVSGQSSVATPETTSAIRPSKQIWEAIVDLEINKHFKIVHSKSNSESAELLVGFAMDIASRHYKVRELLAGETLDMIGNVKSGISVPDTLSKSLGQIKYVTPTLANMVSGVYNNMYELMDSIDKRGNEALEGLKKESGKKSTKVVGSSLANSICMILKSKNPDEYLQP